MTGEQQAWSYWVRLHRMLGDQGLSQATGVRIAAEMLAAARLFNDVAKPFVKPGEELTTQGWGALRCDADRLWRARRDRESMTPEAVSPFSGDPDLEGVRPGQFELFRHWIDDLVGRRRLFEEPDALLDLALRLASEAAGSSHELGASTEVSQLMTLLARIEPQDRVLCAFGGTGEAALRLARKGAHVVLELPNRDAAAFWASLATAVDLPMTVLVTNPFEDLLNDWVQPKASFDVALVAPPFNMKVQNPHVPPGTGLGLPPATSEAWGVALGARRARRQSVCLLPNGFLFRASALDQQFKDRAIRQYGLTTVVALPPGTATRGSNVAASVLLFEPQKPGGKVLMVEHSEKHGRKTLNDRDLLQIEALVRRRENRGSSRLIGYEEIAENQFNLLPDRYVLSDGALQLQKLMARAATVPLGELVDIYRPQATSPTPDSADNDLDAPRELSVSDLDEVGLARRPTKTLTVSQADSFKLRKAELRPGDVLLVTKGSVGKVGYVGDIPEDEYWVANQSFAVLRLRRNSPLRDSRVLFRFLNSGMGQTLIQRLRVGATIATLQMADIKQLPVLVPQPVDQHRIAEEVEQLFAAQAHINALRSQLVEHQHNIWPDVELGGSA